MVCRDCEGIVQSALRSHPIVRGRPGPGQQMPTTAPSTADRSYTDGRGSIWTVPPWQIGLAGLRHCWNHWLKRWAVMCAQVRPSPRMIPRSTCRQKANVPPRGSGPLSMTNGPAAELIRLPRSASASDRWRPMPHYRLTPNCKGEHPSAHLASDKGRMHADSYTGLKEMYRSGAIREVA